MSKKCKHSAEEGKGCEGLRGSRLRVQAALCERYFLSHPLGGKMIWKMPLGEGERWGEGLCCGKSRLWPETTPDFPAFLAPPVLAHHWYGPDCRCWLCYVTESRFQHVRLWRHLLSILLLESVRVRWGGLLSHTHTYKQITPPTPLLDICTLHMPKHGHEIERRNLHWEETKAVAQALFGWLHHRSDVFISLTWMNSHIFIKYSL